MSGNLLAALLFSMGVAASAPAAGWPVGGAVLASGEPRQAGPVVVQAETGRVVGVVTAPDGARLPGVRITVTSLESGRPFVVMTAGHGGYTASGLPAGEYSVEAALPGFEPQVAGRVTVGPKRDTEVTFRLPLSTVTESVTVVGELLKDSVEPSTIRDSSAKDIGEALGGQTGVALVRKGAIANDIALNGYQSRNLTVLIDGERIYGACPNGMDPALFHADFAEVDHLEIGKGPFDVRHQGSLGGLVNVVTRAPGAGLRGRLTLSAGSRGYVNPSAVGSIGSSRVSGLGGYSYRTARPYRDGSGALFTTYANFRADQAGSAAYGVQTGWGRLFFAPRPSHSAQLAYTRQQADHVLYPYLLMDGITDAADRLNASWGVVSEDGPIRTLSVRASYAGVSHWMTDALRVSSVGVGREYSMATRADSGTASGAVEMVAGPVTAGVEAFRRSWEATTEMAGSKYVPQYGIPAVAIDTIGAFADYQRNLGSQTTLAAGGRFDYSVSRADQDRANRDLYFAYKGTRAVRATDAGASGKLRVVRRVGSGVQVWAGVGRTMRVPDPVERYFALKRMGSDWVGNPALRPTTNTGLQLGASYHSHRALASLSLFADRLGDFVVVHGQRKVNAVAGVMNGVARSFANVDARMRGAEVSLTLPLTDRLAASIDGTLTRGTKAVNAANGITSANMAEIAPATGSVSLRYDRAAVFAEVRGVFGARQGRVDADLREAPTPGYGILNLRVGAQVGVVRFTVALDNAFDRLYVDYNSYQRDPYRTGVRVREPGRSLHASLSTGF